MRSSVMLLPRLKTVPLASFLNAPGAARCTSVYLLTLLLFLGLPWTRRLRAQVTTADVTGTVLDSSDAVVPDVKISLTSRATGQSFTAVSSSEGEYSFRLLPIGRYSMEAEKAGFKKWSSPDVALAVGDRL